MCLGFWEWFSCPVVVLRLCGLASEVEEIGPRSANTFSLVLLVIGSVVFVLLFFCVLLLWSFVLGVVIVSGFCNCHGNRAQKSSSLVSSMFVCLSCLFLDCFFALGRVSCRLVFCSSGLLLLFFVVVALSPVSWLRVLVLQSCWCSSVVHGALGRPGE